MRNPCKECIYYHKENNICQSKKCCTGGEGRVTWFDRLFCKPCKRMVKATAELKPCPLCGGEASLIAITYDRRYRVACDDCDASTKEYWDEEEAIEAWNRGDE